MTLQVEGGRPSSEMQIALAELIKEPRRLISGRDVGRNFRERLGGRQKFEKYDTFKVIVPEGTRIISPSLFLGLIGTEMKLLGSVDEITRHIKLEGATPKTKSNFMTAARTSLISDL